MAAADRHPPPGRMGADVNGYLALALIVLAVWCLRSGKSARTGRAASGHVHSGRRGLVARHEAGHYVVARKVGGRVHSADLTSGATPSGLVQATVPDARASITFLMAGRAAAGTRSGCSADDAEVRRTLREFPSAERGQVRRECERDARRIVSSSRGEIRRIASRLEQEGTL